MFSMKRKRLSLEKLVTLLLYISSCYLVAISRFIRRSDIRHTTPDEIRSAHHTPHCTRNFGSICTQIRSLPIANIGEPTAQYLACYD
jgi:hypothetical protein